MTFPFFLYQACAAENLEKKRDFAYLTAIILRRAQQTPERAWWGRQPPSSPAATAPYLQESFVPSPACF